MCDSKSKFGYRWTIRVLSSVSVESESRVEVLIDSRKDEDTIGWVVGFLADVPTLAIQTVSATSLTLTHSDLDFLSEGSASSILVYSIEGEPLRGLWFPKSGR